MFPRSSSWMDSARVPSSPLASGPDESSRTRSPNDTNRHHAPVQIADDATARVTRRTGKRAFPRESGPPSPKNSSSPFARRRHIFFSPVANTRVADDDDDDCISTTYRYTHTITESRHHARRGTRARSRARPDLSQRLRPTARRITLVGGSASAYACSLDAAPASRNQMVEKASTIAREFAFLILQRRTHRLRLTHAARGDDDAFGGVDEREGRGDGPF